MPTTTPRTNQSPYTAQVHTWDTPSEASGDEQQRLDFWDQAASLLEWDRPWQTTHHWTPPNPQTRRGPVIRWFEEGKLLSLIHI